MTKVGEILKNARKVILIYEVLSKKSHEEAAFIVEGSLEMRLNNRYSARHDRGLQPNQQDHVHIYKKGKQVCVVNMDGSPSHNSQNTTAR